MLVSFRSLLPRLAHIRAQSSLARSSQQLVDELQKADEHVKKSIQARQNAAAEEFGTKINWKPFRKDAFIRPHQLTFNNRNRDLTPRKKPFRVAPGSAESRYNDWFHQQNIDPLVQATNPAMFIDFVSEMGKIYGRNLTKLTNKNQRRLGKAVRRSRHMGIIPILSRPQNLQYRS